MTRLRYDHLMGYAVPPARQRVTPDHCILYALGVGVGASHPASSQTSSQEPLPPSVLRLVYEKDLVALPMMGNVVAAPGFWLQQPDSHVNWAHVLHGEQFLRLHRAIPLEVDLIGETRVVGIRDRGPDRGAFVYIERTVHEAQGRIPVCTAHQTVMLRADGGCGGDDPPPRRCAPTPERPPDHSLDHFVAPQAALLYRLNGDRNPLHADPEVAAAAGFARPILHGLCTLGMAGVAVMQQCFDFDPDRINDMGVRFAAPVYPGETLQTLMWQEGSKVSFRTIAKERDVVVLDHGHMGYAPREELERMEEGQEEGSS